MIMISLTVLRVLMHLKYYNFYVSVIFILLLYHNNLTFIIILNLRRDFGLVFSPKLLMRFQYFNFRINVILHMTILSE